MRKEFKLVKFRDPVRNVELQGFCVCSAARWDDFVARINAIPVDQFPMTALAATSLITYNNPADYLRKFEVIAITAQDARMLSWLFDRDSKLPVWFTWGTFIDLTCYV